MKNIIYLSSFLPREKKEYYSSKMHNFNFNSADAFSYSVFCGLANNLGTDLKVINIPPLGSYPRYNDLLHSCRHSEIDKNVRVTSISNSNLYVYQYYSIYKNVLNEIKLYKNIAKPILLIYGINIPVILAALKFRDKYSPQSKIILIVPDLIEDCMAESLNSKIKMMLIGDINKIYSQMDGFVLLTELMTEKIKTSKPYCIVEGIYNPIEIRRQRIKKSTGQHVIFYSGMLYEKFGVKTLLDAFSQIQDPNLSLQLCGCGELEETIKKKQLTDQRIQYLGLLPREQVLELQSNADLLVNPRTSLGDFTKYSFPSKNIEYLVSGTPALIYKLPGIPDEYYDYCYTLNPGEMEVELLREKLIEILAIPENEREKLAKKAQDFIINHKNAPSQTQKIINLITSLQ